MGIQHPDIILPDRNDTKNWALIPALKGKWAEYVMPQMGYSSEDVHTYLLGGALNSFLYDNGNLFGLIEFTDGYHEVAEEMQREMLAKLTWETSLGVFPFDIQEGVAYLREVISGQDWHDREQVLKSFHIWRELKESLVKRTKNGGDLKNVFEGSVKIEKAIGPYWQEFVARSR